MSVVATDNFNRADSGTLGANWTHTKPLSAGAETLRIVSNRANGNISGEFPAAFWSNDVFANDQYSKFTIVDLGGGSWFYASARTTGNSGVQPSGYFSAVNMDGRSYLTRQDAGSQTILTGDDAGGFTNGNVTETRAVGTLISYYKDAALINSASDATYASGSAGIALFDNLTNADDWEGGNVGAALKTFYLH